MIVLFELEHDCKTGTTLAASGSRSLRAYAGRILAHASVGIIIHRGEGKIIKHRHQTLTFKVEPLVELVGGL